MMKSTNSIYCAASAFYQKCHGEESWIVKVRLKVFRQIRFMHYLDLVCDILFTFSNVNKHRSHASRSQTSGCTGVLTIWVDTFVGKGDVGQESPCDLAPVKSYLHFRSTIARRGYRPIAPSAIIAQRGYIASFASFPDCLCELASRGFRLCCTAVYGILILQMYSYLFYVNIW